MTKAAKPADKPLEFIEGMLGCLYKTPACYATTVGELNGILWMVHHLWSGFADREWEYIDVRCDIYTAKTARRIERIRTDPISNVKSLKTMLNLWKKIDRKLGLDTRAERYDPFALNSRETADRSPR